MLECLLNLARLHYQFGLIDLDEYNERCSIAFWLDDNNEEAADPRDESLIEPEKMDGHSAAEDVAVKRQPNNQDGSICLLLLGVWNFTKADADHYPSVPHGHYKKKNQKWPKLNPYNGRVFSEKHQEDKTRRLNRTQMRLVWRNEEFKSFCRDVIVWYLEAYPVYNFPVPHPFRLPRW